MHTRASSNSLNVAGPNHVDFYSVLLQFNPRALEWDGPSGDEWQKGGKLRTRTQYSTLAASVNLGTGGVYACDSNQWRRFWRLSRRSTLCSVAAPTAIARWKMLALFAVSKYWWLWKWVLLLRWHDICKWTWSNSILIRCVDPLIVLLILVSGPKLWTVYRVCCLGQQKANGKSRSIRYAWSRCQTFASSGTFLFFGLSCRDACLLVFV
jgi:hypothetical protein